MSQTTRREFVKTVAATGAGFWLLSGVQPKLSASTNEKIAFAGVGVGGKGQSDIEAAAKYCDIVALCDVDRRRLASSLEKYPDAKGFTDYRELLDSMGDKIDGITISTADHTHAAIALKAMRMKKHCFVQKPLTRTIYEARLMGKVATETGVCTQMGNQGSANSRVRGGAARLKAGVDGVVKEIHVWTNRPIWPQGPGISQTLASYKKKLDDEDSEDAGQRYEAMEKRIQKELKDVIDWESWIGPAKFREYFPEIYHWFNWRGYWDFGTGALGDIACHALNKHMAGLDLGAPKSVVAVTSGHDFDAFPAWSVIDYEYPDTAERSGFKFTWYDGGKKPPVELLNKYGIPEDSISGEIIVYEEGTAKDVPVPRYRRCPVHTPGDDDNTQHTYEFVCAIRENNPGLCFSNFPKQAGPLTEAMLLGNLAVWTAYEPEKRGETIEWNAAKMEVTNLASIQTPGTVDLIKPTYRPGYELDV